MDLALVCNFMEDSVVKVPKYSVTRLEQGVDRNFLDMAHMQYSRSVNRKAGREPFTQSHRQAKDQRGEASD